MPTYTPIQSITLTESMSSVTISNIPQNYTDLIISIASSSTHTVNDDIQFRFNGDTGSNYSQVRLFTVNEISTGASDRQTSSTYIGGAWQPATNSTSGSVGITYSQIFNYSSTTMNKTVFNTMDLYSFKAVVGKTCGVWRNTSAINSVTLFSQYGAKIAAGSIINVYGISPAAANNAQAFGGTDIFYDSSYVYHVFKASGTFTPIRNLTADILMIAGGAGGGSSNGGGGGGAGGLLYTSSSSFTASVSYPVVIGAGGSYQEDGNNTTFKSLTALKGGRGGNNGGGGIGGSSTYGSGGGNGRDSGSSSGGAGTSGQGFAGGGPAIGSNANGGGGGGGAGGTGYPGKEDSSANNGGLGGIGSSTYSSWGSATSTGENVSGTYYYAGGGGGCPVTGNALGGSGGGGRSATYNASGTKATSGITNTGSGGGGGGTTGWSSLPGNGGSGLVIVRYAR